MDRRLSEGISERRLGGGMLIQIGFACRWRVDFPRFVPKGSWLPLLTFILAARCNETGRIAGHGWGESQFEAMDACRKDLKTRIADKE